MSGCNNFYSLILTLSLCSCLFMSHSIPSVSYLRNNASLTWTNNDNPSFPAIVRYSDGSVARFLLVNDSRTMNGDMYGYGSCFYCTSPGKASCYFSVVFVVTRNGTFNNDKPLVIWTANREAPVGENSRLILSNRGFVLIDEYNGTAWTMTSSGMNVSGIGMDIDGNLLLVDNEMEIVWQSFYYPTDTLLVGQQLHNTQRLVSSISSSNFGAGPFHLTPHTDTLAAFLVGDDHPINYLSYSPYFKRSILLHVSYIQFNPDNVTFYYENSTRTSGFSFRRAPAQFLRIDQDGGTRIYGWEIGSGWKVIYVLLNGNNECQLPLKCGRYGVCQKEQCTCPVAVDGADYFRPVDTNFPNLGCQERTPKASKENAIVQYVLVDFGPLSYFSFPDSTSATPFLHDEEGCKQACLKNVSCKASFFVKQRHRDASLCYLTSDVLSLTRTQKKTDYYTSCHIKVRIDLSRVIEPAKLASRLWKVAAFVSGLCVLALFSLGLLLLKVKKNWKANDHDNLIPLPESLVRFSYNELYNATENFSVVLGKGGFGFVFKGILQDGTKVAVKRLECSGQGIKEFLAEVNTIGNIHHINLVRLIGYCVDTKHRMLVYEYMSNGSLDKWLFDENDCMSLSWEMRKRILLDVAKGLAYLHEDCRQKIVHLDIKPHNVLLDDAFNAKLSDFGLSKLINRDNTSEVITCIRGTPGYIAPDWRQHKITVKADTYSFGIVVLELVSGRKVIDYSLPKSSVHLLHFLHRKVTENRLIDIIDHRCADMQTNADEVIKFITIAMWCLNGDHTKRPKMSSVVNVVEGNMEIEDSITSNFPLFLSPTLTISNSVNDAENLGTES